jgi:hypothetical protein
MTLRELNKKKLYTANQLRNWKKFKNKFLDTYPLHYEYKNDKGQWETVYEVRGISDTIKENFQTVEEILN